ncbi:MAG: rod shape-determining protein MreC [Pseudomonadota bacterium]
MKSFPFPVGSPSLFPRGPGVGLKTLVLCMTALVLMVVDRRGDSVDGLREALTVTLKPLFWVTSLPGRTAVAVTNYQTRDSLLEENAQLKQEQFLLNSRLQKLDSLQAENTRIRELLSSSTQLEERVLIAEVLSAAQDPYRHQILLDKGARDGVYRGQAVVDASGVLGQVIQVNAYSSMALLITDPNHGIPVEINRTGLQTIALGRGDGQRLSLPYLPSNADIKAGDLLVSSPLGGRFPAGYPVGEIIETRPSHGDNFMEALAKPAAHINQGRQALLVWSESYPVPEPPPAPAPEAIEPENPE